jgi:hypothetical protein
MRAIGLSASAVDWLIGCGEDPSSVCCDQPHAALGVEQMRPVDIRR